MLKIVSDCVIYRWLLLDLINNKLYICMSQSLTGVFDDLLLSQPNSQDTVLRQNKANDETMINQMRPILLLKQLK